jgi:hypothetical protein
MEQVDLGFIHLQGCPLALFLYLFVVDSLGYLLKEDDTINGLRLPGTNGDVIDQEYADDTILYPEGSLLNLNNTKRALETFSLATGTKINWNKSHEIWKATTPCPFTWRKDVGLHWLQPDKTTWYLGFYIGFQISAKP